MNTQFDVNSPSLLTTTSKRSHYISLLLISLCLLLPGLFSLPMDDRDSAHNAQATKQMLETGQYFQIRFQDTTRFQKPPGMNWLQALSVKAFSEASSSLAWPYRLPSALGGIFSILLLYAIAKSRVGTQTAWIASLLLASTLLLNIESHLIVIDAMLLVSILLMQAGLWACYDAYLKKSTAAWYWPLLFWLAMSWGICLKGVSPLVGLLTLVSLALWHRDWRLLKAVKPISGLFVLLLSSAWLINVNQAEHSNYLWQLIQKDLLPKLKGGHESHGMPPGYHLLLLPLTFWPASLFLWRGLVRGYRYCQQPIERFLLCWIIPTWIFFECMPTKLPQYTLPTFPALALLTALALTHLEKISGLKILTALWWGIGIAIGIALWALPVLILQHTLPMTVFMALGVIFLSLLAVVYAWKGQIRSALFASLVLAMISYFSVFQLTLPALTPIWTTDRIAESIRDLPISSDRPLISVGYDEPSLVFAIGTQAVRYASPEQALEWVNLHHDNILVIDERHREKLLSRFQAAGYSCALIQTIKSLNYSKGEWLELSIYRVA